MEKEDVQIKSEESGVGRTWIGEGIALVQSEGHTSNHASGRVRSHNPPKEEPSGQRPAHQTQALVPKKKKRGGGDFMCVEFLL